jgi:hypothetical protein
MTHLHELGSEADESREKIQELHGQLNTDDALEGM